jgi:hypothetical protein
MSAQPQKKGWKHWLAQRLEPVTPQLAASAQNWNPVRDPCPEHPQTSMYKVLGPDGKPMWKCPRCGTDAMQAIPPRPQILVNPTRLLGMARNQRAAELVKPLPPKPALLQTNPDLKKEACQPPPALPPRYELPRLTTDQRIVAFESINTLPINPAKIGQKPPDLTGVLPPLPSWVLAAMPVEIPEPEDKWVNTNPTASGPLPVNYAEVEVWGEREKPAPSRAELFADVDVDKQPTIVVWDELLRHNSETLELTTPEGRAALKKKESE